MKLVALAHEHPRLVAWIGSLSGLAAIDWLRTGQIVAAWLAGLASLIAIILTAPKAIAEVKRWFQKSP